MKISDTVYTVIDPEIYEVLENSYLNIKDRISLVIKSFHEELVKNFTGQAISVYLLENVKVELSIFLDNLVNKLFCPVKLEADLRMIDGQLVVVYPNLPNFLAQF